ncbi:MAG: acyl-CoA dehydrogenase family protein, partial [Acidimicrobiales bacterium]
MTTPLEALDAFVATASKIPLPGAGQTPQRLATLADIAGAELSLGRLAEGHADALAILAEADQAGDPGRWGVWAARSADADLDARDTGGMWVLDGAKAFCSGAGVLDRALVTARAGGAVRLFHVRLDHPGVSVLAGTWPSVGMAASMSATVRFAGVPAEAVGPPGFYTERPGFWFGAVGGAACWAGGARALVDRVAQHLAEGQPDHATLADLGVGASAVAAAFAVLDAAGEA